MINMIHQKREISKAVWWARDGVVVTEKRCEGCEAATLGGTSSQKVIMLLGSLHL